MGAQCRSAQRAGMMGQGGVPDRSQLVSPFSCGAWRSDPGAVAKRIRTSALWRAGHTMSYVVAYAGALVLFVAMDFAWLSTLGAALYRSTLGDLLATSVRLPRQSSSIWPIPSASWCSPRCRRCGPSRRSVPSCSARSSGAGLRHLRSDQLRHPARLVAADRASSTSSTAPWPPAVAALVAYYLLRGLAPWLGAAPGERRGQRCPPSAGSG